MMRRMNLTLGRRAWGLNMVPDPLEAMASSETDYFLTCHGNRSTLDRAVECCRIYSLITGCQSSLKFACCGIAQSGLVCQRLLRPSDAACAGVTLPSDVFCRQRPTACARRKSRTGCACSVGGIVGTGEGSRLALMSRSHRRGVQKESRNRFFK